MTDSDARAPLVAAIARRRDEIATLEAALALLGDGAEPEPRPRKAQLALPAPAPKPAPRKPGRPAKGAAAGRLPRQIADCETEVNGVKVAVTEREFAVMEFLIAAEADESFVPQAKLLPIYEGRLGTMFAALNKLRDRLAKAKVTIIAHDGGLRLELLKKA